MLDGTRTKCGARLLRASLLQPLRDVATLNERYSCVGELLEDEEMAFNVAACLQKLPKDLDRWGLGRQNQQAAQHTDGQTPHTSHTAHAFLAGCAAA